MIRDIELGNVMVDGGLLIKFLTSVGKKMLYSIYTFVLVPRHLHEHSYASVSVRKSCFHMRMNIHMFVHITRIAIVLFDSYSKNRFQIECHEW